MQSPSDIQKIIDHFHIGRIKEIEEKPDYYKVETNQGVFFVIWGEPVKARATEEFRRDKLAVAVGQLERLLLPDYKGELQEYSSYAHLGKQKGLYYSVYKLVK